jgi:NitT/TauT family transport system substrate-binding protein
MKRLLSFAAALTISLNAITAAYAAPKKEFNVAWTIYVGWMPWPYAADNGIVKKWADKYGITINVRQINDYVESINQYTAGKFDGVTVTNMDALTIPAAGGVDTTAIIMGDYSNGNDGVVLKKGKTLADIKGEKVNLVELSVSHYLLARGLDRETSGKGHQDRQHVGCRHRGGDQIARHHRGGHLESAASGSEVRPRRHAGVRLQQDPR